MALWQHDGLAFHYREAGHGTPFVFQHGLGGDVNQPFGLFTPPPGTRLLAFDCRGHGETRPLGDPAKISFLSFADDLRALLDHLQIARAVVGGISMGAGVALNFALRFPDRLLGLVLSRPAWLDRPLPDNLAIYPRLVELIRAHGAKNGLDLFLKSAEYAAIKRESPDAADSLAGQFTQPRAEQALARLERIPRDGPNSDHRAWTSIRVPTLVLANRQDPIHPFNYGVTLARAIPTAQFRELTPKSVDKLQHVQDVQAFVEEFLQTQLVNERIAAC